MSGSKKRKYSSQNSSSEILYIKCNYDKIHADARIIVDKIKEDNSEFIIKDWGKKEIRLNTNPFLVEDIKLKRIIIATMISNIFMLLD